MIEVDELNNAEIVNILHRVGYGHLGCSVGDQPYVVPVHYAFDDREIYLYTTDGKKSTIIDENPLVCLQVEDVEDNQHWESVIVNGKAARVRDEAARERALRMIVEVNPTLTPAVSIHWMDNWVRENIEVIYRIVPFEMTGRRAVERTSGPANLVPGDRTVQ